MNGSITLLMNRMRCVLPYPCFRWGNRVLERLSKLPQFTQFELVELEFEPRQLFLEFVSLTPCCPTSLIYMEDLALIYTYIYDFFPFSSQWCQTGKKIFPMQDNKYKARGKHKRLGEQKVPQHFQFHAHYLPIMLWLGENRFYYLSSLQMQSENSERWGDLPKVTQQGYGTARIRAPVSWTCLGCIFHHNVLLAQSRTVTFSAGEHVIQDLAL